MNIKVFHVGDEVIVVIYRDYKKSLRLINFICDKLFYRNRLRNLTLKQLEVVKKIIDDNKEE